MASLACSTLSPADRRSRNASWFIGTVWKWGCWPKRHTTSPRGAANASGGGTSESASSACHSATTLVQMVRSRTVGCSGALACSQASGGSSLASALSSTGVSAMSKRLRKSQSSRASSNSSGLCGKRCCKKSANVSP